MLTWVSVKLSRACITDCSGLEAWDYKERDGRVTSVWVWSRELGRGPCELGSGGRALSKGQDGALNGVRWPGSYRSLQGTRPSVIYHEASFHRGHERQLAPIPHAEFLQLPRTEPAGGRKEEGETGDNTETRKRRPRRRRAVRAQEVGRTSALPTPPLAPQCAPGARGEAS